MTMKFRRFFTRAFRNDEPGADGTGDSPVIDVQATEVAAPDAPKTMLEAVEASFSTPEAKQTPAEPEKTPVEPVKPEIKVDPAKPEDLTKMPDGLSKPAQERFQKLANANKELSEQHRQVLDSVEPFRKALQENGIVKEQFDQAASVIGMMNRGDLEGALKELDEQRRLLSLAMGKPIPGVDALSGYPDLRTKVDQMQITEEDALEIARTRSQESTRQTLMQREQEKTQQQEQQRKSQEQEQQAWTEGLNAVDKFTSEMKKSDIDFAAIEAKLLPRIPALIQGVPPAQWAEKVKNLYELIKETAGSTRSSTSSGVLRPTGQQSPSQAPKSMHEAMWGGQP